VLTGVVVLIVVGDELEQATAEPTSEQMASERKRRMRNS
jgi:hypothetical protein